MKHWLNAIAAQPVAATGGENSDDTLGLLAAVELDR